MKAKIRDTKKDIYIDVKIENNLMSKNKQLNNPDEIPDANDEKPKQNSGGSSASVPSNVTKLLSEYSGMMAQRDLYKQTQLLPFPYNPYAMITNNPNNATTPNPQNSATNQAIENNNDDDDDDQALETSINEVIEQNDDDDFEINDDPDVMTIYKGYEFLNKQQEVDYLASLKRDDRSKRKSAIRRIKLNVRVRPATIQEFKLAKYVRRFNRPYWESLPDIDAF
jgi:hypothetical protein